MHNKLFGRVRLAGKEANKRDSESLLNGMGPKTRVRRMYEVFYLFYLPIFPLKRFWAITSGKLVVPLEPPQQAVLDRAHLDHHHPFWHYGGSLLLGFGLLVLFIYQVDPPSLDATPRQTSTDWRTPKLSKRYQQEASRRRRIMEVDSADYLIWEVDRRKLVSRVTARDSQALDLEFSRPIYEMNKPVDAAAYFAAGGRYLLRARIALADLDSVLFTQQPDLQPRQMHLPGGFETKASPHEAWTYAIPSEASLQPRTLSAEQQRLSAYEQIQLALTDEIKAYVPRRLVYYLSAPMRTGEEILAHIDTASVRHLRELLAGAKLPTVGGAKRVAYRSEYPLAALQVVLYTRYVFLDPRRPRITDPEEEFIAFTAFLKNIPFGLFLGDRMAINKEIFRVTYAEAVNEHTLLATLGIHDVHLQGKQYVKFPVKVHYEAGEWKLDFISTFAYNQNQLTGDIGPQTVGALGYNNAYSNITEEEAIEHLLETVRSAVPNRVIKSGPWL